MKRETSPEPGSEPSTKAISSGTAPLEIVVAESLITIIPAHIVTSSGGYWVATHGGGVGSADSGAGSSALRTDALIGGEFETFTIEILNYREFALMTSGGFYITAVDGGDTEKIDDAKQPVVTDGTSYIPDARFYFRRFGKNQVRIRTADNKHYLTAVNGGGYVGDARSLFRTNVKKIGPTERLQFRDLNKSETHNGPA